MFNFLISLLLYKLHKYELLFVCGLLARSPKIASLAYLIFSVFYIVKNLTYEQLFIWTTIHMFSYNIWRYVQKYILNLCNITNTEILHCCRSYPSYRPDPIPCNPTTLSHIIHYAIIYYVPYNYISIMYISYCYHLSITYYIIKYIIAMHCIIISYINTHTILCST